MSEVVLTWERFADGVKEAFPLMRAHFREVQNFQDVFGFDPEWDYYYQLEAQGFLHILAAREDGKLVGYVGMIISPMLHTRTCIRARTDSFYVAPSHRGKGLWGRMWTEVERRMRDQLGVHRLEFVPKCRYGKILGEEMFTDRGYELIEATFAKIIQEPRDDNA